MLQESLKEVLLQLLLTFELELVKNQKLQLINYELEKEVDYVGKEIVHGNHPHSCEIDVDALEKIAINAAEELLKRGSTNCVYKLYIGDCVGNSYCSYPTVFCTNLFALCDTVKGFVDNLLDLYYEDKDFNMHEYLRQNLSVYAYSYKNNDLIVTKIF